MRKTGFMAIVGRPNVGKSTLLNAILGEKVAIVSSKPQTTRNRIIGIHTVEEKQYVFLDTPGIFKPRNSLGNYMVKTANSTMNDADAVILVIDAGKPISDIEETVIKYIKQSVLSSINRNIFMQWEILEVIEHLFSLRDAILLPSIMRYFSTIAIPGVCIVIVLNYFKHHILVVSE